jgi:hypothetical protein
MDQMDHVDGSLNYLAEMSEKPVSYTYEPPPGVPARTSRTVKLTVPIHDGRAIGLNLSLDKQGFVLLPHVSAVTNFYDADEVRRVYYPEMERLVREGTGAARVLVFDHNVRNGSQEQRAATGVRDPVRFVHNDYTFKSGPQRVRELMGDAEGERLLKHRFVFLNVWRPIRGPVQEAPLAVCDARSMALKDFVATDLKYRDRTGEVYSVTYNPDHRWFYFPQMLPSEALLLKCFDSDPRRTQFTAHSAFEDPTTPPDAPPRESIEARAIAFFTE